MKTATDAPHLAWLEAQIAAAQAAVNASAAQLALTDAYQQHQRNVAVLEYLQALRVPQEAT